MGGYQWSEDEEKIFWSKIVPLADPKSHGTKRTWGPLSDKMKKEMAMVRPGQEPLRKYTHTGCCKCPCLE